jgi:hypothetical protein
MMPIKRKNDVWVFLSISIIFINLATMAAAWGTRISININVIHALVTGISPVVQNMFW